MSWCLPYSEVLAATMDRATRVLADSMLSDGAFDGAIRLVNSGRLWSSLNAGAQKLEESEMTTR